jgi:hypothetical protein
MSAQQNQNSNERGSAAQMGGEDPLNLDKSELIRRGLKIKALEALPDPEDAHLTASYALGALSFIAANLTSSDRMDRENAKKMVRDLVKLGQGK